MKQKVYALLENFICIGNRKFSLLLREYLYFPVNVSPSSPTISDPIENNFFKLNLAQNEEKVG